MPPCIDVYVLSTDRDPAGIREFLQSYVDNTRDTYDGREVSALPAGYLGQERDLDLKDWDQIPVASCEDIIRVGVGEPPRAFATYFPAKKPLCDVILGFTRTDEVIFGVSVDDPLNEPEPIAQANALLRRLASQSRATHGWAIHEEPPPLDPFVQRPWEDPRVVGSYIAGG